MRKSRWLAPWKDSQVRPLIYHLVSRVVDRRFVFGDGEREHFRMLMRMVENFSGCRVLSYCIMSNHFHILLEVPPLPEGGLTDGEFEKRLLATQTEAGVAEVMKRLATARSEGREDVAKEIIESYTYRMHDLSEFMKSLLQRFTRWFNRTHQRTGTLWEERYKSVIVEGGVASKTIAAYIDLNPVRAGMVNDPADYRWSSYGEAIGGGAKGNGKKARAGLVRALRAHHGVGADAALWADGVSQEYRRLLLMAGVEKLESQVTKTGELATKRKRNGMNEEDAAKEAELAGEIPLAKMLRCRIRYFTDGAVIGSREFVNEAFVNARERFGGKRKDGARKMKGAAAPTSGVLWSLRDLKKDVAPAG